ncbi:glucose-1-phosphate adenylyltransferase [Desulfosporosinus orientis DSM 765]|uniref:Glucose-1-phosphate adenylyltransferase n=1 Tax=Desulfosporosinus orientis (strain ATCC 19365 / DSM 765 / NCIMB 8382 / VKM B-1628 / Singapore I) TaxID=768706 RepID=G7WB93_DESOD|nr:glucose-1-phosphate adenylyltransferase [Desulfosporosinus orientis]AET67874.1 glucose-1-phosphate adenylyltransferase [Desulfosporosinus orientis DSM 765]
MKKQECIAMLLAGGQGSRLGGLTRNRAKPAVSFCGKYRIIDFTLSNCANSNINTVGVLIQYKPFLLNSYIGLGSAWDLDNPFGGVHILPPFLGESEGSWYKGTANAVYQNYEFIEYYAPEYVIILSGDHVYQMDYTQMLKFHKEKGAEITLAAIEVPWEEASRFGILTVDNNARITKFTEKPGHPDSNLASMGVYIFNTSALKQALIEDTNDTSSQNDFGKNIIPQQMKEGKRVFAYRFSGYWRDVGTIESYYQANMESLQEGHFLRIFDPHYKILSNEDILPPHFMGSQADIQNSLICNGCSVQGRVRHSILAPGVYVGEGAEIEDSIILPYAKIHNGSRIKGAIIGESAEIMGQCVIGAERQAAPGQHGITVIEDYHLMGPGTVVESGKHIYRNRTS